MPNVLDFGGLVCLSVGSVVFVPSSSLSFAGQGELHPLLTLTNVVLVAKFVYLFFTMGGLVFEVEVGYFLVFFCGGGWSWHIVWRWY